MCGEVLRTSCQVFGGCQAHTNIPVRCLPLRRSCFAASVAKCSGCDDDALSVAQVSCGERRPMAYVHFRWEDEDGVPILYCYEIQLEAAAQRKGLGRCEQFSALWPSPIAASLCAVDLACGLCEPVPVLSPSRPHAVHLTWGISEACSHITWVACQVPDHSNACRGHQ